MSPKLYFIKTFGCQMNISDSERIASLLEKNNYKPASEITEANLVIFNTCGIRQAAENRAYSLIHTLRKARPEIKIILTGCLANRKDVQKRLEKKVDFFCEIKDFQEKFKNFVIKNYLKTKNLKLKIPAQQKDTHCSNYLSINPKYNNSHSALVPIMTGCNNFCSYCVVPYARGREVSRPDAEIIAEIKNLIKDGCKEITLLGQNVNSYHYSSVKPELNSRYRELSSGSRNVSFPKLLQKIEKIPGHFWIRFMSSHPKDFSDELIETIAKSKKICEHIHLPIQAGSDKILTAMNRKYTAKHYRGLIKKIRSAFKKYKLDTPYSITSDIIVGFPGETKKDFLESAQIMEKVKYDLVYFGQFSPRPGTVAWKMKDNVSKLEKSQREKSLNEILKKTAFSNNQKYSGKTLEVLIDTPGSKSPESGLLEPGKQIYFGRTRTGKDVKIKTDQKNLIGKFVKIKITKANIWNLEASSI
jgi:tRNA-2-methylthio-N6-dimethylallyladenosine synthase